MSATRLCGALPFCDFGEVTDPPSADVTAHAIEMLAAEPGADRGRLREGLAWLRAEQEPGGSWFGRWGANHVYGTGAAVPALVVAGAGPDDPAVARAVTWLERHQNGDGGWGEDLRSYDDPKAIGRGTSTASQTAWGAMALQAIYGPDDPALARAVAWLVTRQLSDADADDPVCNPDRDPAGSWAEQWFTGTGFPRVFYLRYHLYRLYFPLMALARYRQSLLDL